MVSITQATNTRVTEGTQPLWLTSNTIAEAVNKQQNKKYFEESRVANSEDGSFCHIHEYAATERWLML